MAVYPYAGDAVAAGVAVPAQWGGYHGRQGLGDGRGMVARGYNITSEAVSVTLKSRKCYAHIDRLTLGEKYLVSMALDGQVVSFSLAPKEIFTIGLFP